MPILISRGFATVNCSIKKNNMNKKVLVIGGGVSGLATAIYLQINGYNTEILEKNAVLGGACIGWDRKDCYIDGCIHWLVGTKPNTGIHEIWLETGALGEGVKVYNQRDFYTLDFPCGKKFNVWTDFKKTEEELISFAPEDKKQIKKFCKLIKRFQRINPPVEKPVDLMNVLDLLKIGLTMAGDYYYVNKTSKISCEDYGKKFKNPYISRWIAEHMSSGYNLMSFLYMLGHVTANDGGIPEGGSLAMVERMQSRYLSLGGKIRRGAEVKTVDVEKGVAKGVTLKTGEKLTADWVVASTPSVHTVKDLLGGTYPVKEIDERLKDRKTYPIYTYTTAIFKVSADMQSAPISHKVYLDSPIRLNEDNYSVVFRNYSYDKTLKAPKGSCVIQGTIGGDDEMYFWWKEVKEKWDYKAKKQEIAQKILDVYLEKYPELTGKVEIIDVVTPMTYQRYLNGRNGSFQAFVQTAKAKAMMRKGEIKGLKNFVMSGQWLLTSGGLPPAAITGRFAAQRICKRDKLKFKRA